MQRLSNAARASIEEIRSAAEPSEADKQRIAARLRGLLAVPTGKPGSVTAPLTKVGAVLAVIVGAGVAMYAWRVSDRGVPTEVNARQAEVMAGSSSTTPTTQLTQPKSPATPTAPGLDANLVHNTNSDGKSLGAELELIRAGHNALHRADPVAALEAMAQYQRIFAHGALQEEAMAIRVVSQCNLGQPDTRAAADQFFSQYPDSPQAPRVKAACYEASATSAKVGEGNP